MIQRLALLFWAGAALTMAQTESPVAGVGPFLHIVSDLDQSLAFYHDTLGFEITGPAGAEHKFTDNPAVANLYGVPGKQFRAAVLKIPGSAMGIELVQWGEARKPIAGQGRVGLVLHGGAQHPGPLVDPDGFPVEEKISDIAFAELTVGVRDVAQTMALYTKVLGFPRDGDTLTVPGSDVRIRFIQAGKAGGGSSAFPEPGQGMLRLFVSNAQALTDSLKSAGFTVITTGGAPVTLPQGQQVVILRDPNGFYLQPMQAK
jgi:catechol 2,3-dioxygenase-like lactoylglutathione lyase family enzyme